MGYVVVAVFVKENEGMKLWNPRIVDFSLAEIAAVEEYFLSRYSTVILYIYITVLLVKQSN